MAVGDVCSRHRIPLRPVRDPRTGRSSTPACALGVGSDANLVDSDRILLLVDLDAVTEHQPVGNGVAVGDPPVVLRPSRAALGAEKLLVDVGAALLPPVRPRDDGEARPDTTGALRQAVAVPRVGDRALRRHHQPLPYVRRRHRARVREARNADHAVLAQPHLHAPEGARVVRDVRVDRVEDPSHAVVHRARSRLVYACREAVDVVGQIGLDHPCFGIDRDRHPDRDPVGSRAERVVHPLADDRPGRHRRDHVRNATLGVVEPLLDELLQRPAPRTSRRAPSGAPRRSGPRRSSRGSRRTTGRVPGSGGGTCGSHRRRRCSPAARAPPGRSGCPPRRRLAHTACKSSAARSRSRPGAPWRQL